MLDLSIIEAIIAAWNADENHPHRGRTRCTLPPQAVLLRFVDEVFLATLRDEEGRLVPFSIALVSDDEAMEFERHQTLAPLIFERPIPFASSTLPKVAAAFEPEISTLAVKWQPSSGDLIIWGVFPHRRRAGRFSEISCGVPGQAPHRRDCFTAISRGRGSFAIARGDSLIGSFQAGYFVAASPTILTARSLGGHLIALIDQDSLFQAHGNYYWHEFRDAVELLIRESAYRGHGGTLVLLPSGSNSEQSHMKRTMCCEITTG